MPLKEWVEEVEVIIAAETLEKDLKDQLIKRMLLFWLLITLKNLFMVIKTHGLLSSMHHGVDIVKDLHLNGLLWPLNSKVKLKSLKLMQLKLNKLHQDLVSEDTQQSNFSNQDKKMIQQQLTMKEEEVNKQWLTGQDNNYLI